MNINKEMKEDAINSAMGAIFEKRVNDLNTLTSALAQRIYDERYGVDMALFASAGKKAINNWFDNLVSGITVCVLRKNGDCEDVHSPDYSFGYRYKNTGITVPDYCYDKLRRGCYSLSKSSPMPSRTYGSEELVDKTDIERATEYHKAMNALCQEEQDLRIELWGFLKSCRTLKAIETNWPEGVKYFPAAPPSKLPIPPINKVQAAMKKAA